MSKSTPAELNEFGTTDEPTDDREECWCADGDLACFPHFRAEKRLRGEH